MYSPTGTTLLIGMVHATHIQSGALPGSIAKELKQSMSTGQPLAEDSGHT